MTKGRDYRSRRQAYVVYGCPPDGMHLLDFSGNFPALYSDSPEIIMAHKPHNHIQSFITDLPRNAARIIHDLPANLLSPDGDLRHPGNLLRSVLTARPNTPSSPRTSDRNIITWNSGAERIFGYTRERSSAGRSSPSSFRKRRNNPPTPANTSGTDQAKGI